MFRYKKFLWISPILLIIASIINLLNSETTNGFRTVWIVMLLISIIQLGVGIFLHYNAVVKK